MVRALAVAGGDPALIEGDLDMRLTQVQLPGVAFEVGAEHRDQLPGQCREGRCERFVIDQRGEVELAWLGGCFPFLALAQPTDRAARRLDREQRAPAHLALPHCDALGHEGEGGGVEVGVEQALPAGLLRREQRMGLQSGHVVCLQSQLELDFQ